MKIPTYPFVKRQENCYYEFYSEGPNGIIKKVVEYFRLQELEIELFNLAYGDWDEDNQRINDLTITNNSDRDKVLATVAVTVKDFMNDHPDAVIFATGSTLSRTRLYQIGIARELEEVSQYFEIQGYVNNSWRPFQKGVNYSAFLIKTR